jgi:hypothetical protein
MPSMYMKEIFIFKYKQRGVAIIPEKDDCDFLRRKWDIRISIFSRIWTLTLAEFNHTSGPAIIHDAVKNAESDEG